MRFNYRTFIEQYFTIDDARTGRLVPFRFNPVQEQYYEDLKREYDIERMGINAPIRENVLKARREGFSSFILALFACDDITQDNPTETDVLSYKDDATKTFRKRYRNYVLSFFAHEAGLTSEEIADNINVLEDLAPHVLSIDAEDIEIKENKAHFQCNTASARVGGRGGVRHKTLFSEIAFYPDTEKMQASEMVEATMRQTDPASGWIFAESTENGVGTYQHRMWTDAKIGRSRFKNRFYGAGHFYTNQQIEIIKSEYVDMDAFRRDYPMTEDDLFRGAARNFATEDELLLMNHSRANKEMLPDFLELQGENGIDVCETIAAHLERLEKAHKGHALYAAIDEAKITDATVCGVLKDIRRDLSGGVKGIEIDTTRGDFIADWFEKNTNWYVRRMRFSRPTKSTIFTNLQAVIADQATKLPEFKDGKEWISDESKHFLEQMTHLEKDIKGGLLVVGHPKGSCSGSDHNYDECPFHDDYPDMWAMAEDLYQEINGAPTRSKKPPVHTVPNAIQNLLEGAQGRARSRFRTGGYE